MTKDVSMPPFTFSSAKVHTRIDIVFNVVDSDMEQRINERLEQINGLLDECAVDISVNHNIIKRFS